METYFSEVTDHTAKKLHTRESAAVVTYKQHLMEIIKYHKIFHRINRLQEKLTKNLLKQEDIKDINDLEALITSEMLTNKRNIKNILNHYPWLPTLEVSILEVSLWKHIIFDIKNDLSKERQIQRVMKKLKATTLVDRNFLKAST